MPDPIMLLYIIVAKAGKRLHNICGLYLEGKLEYEKNNTL